MWHEGTKALRGIGIAALAATLLAGCAGGSTAPIDLVPAEPHQWLYWPASMRIHPLTRPAVDDETGRPMIEARVEFLDRDGVTTRAVGQMYLSYFESRAQVPGEPIEQWQVELDVPAVNAERFDIVTRTYLFKLVLDVVDAPEGGVLQAFYRGNDGRELSDTLDLEE